MLELPSRDRMAMPARLFSLPTGSKPQHSSLLARQVTLFYPGKLTLSPYLTLQQQNHFCPFAPFARVHHSALDLLEKSTRVPDNPRSTWVRFDIPSVLKTGSSRPSGHA